MITGPTCGRIIILMETGTTDWLLTGDPSIRWQVMRDLLNETLVAYEHERVKVAENGWGQAILARQNADGHWGGGVYNPKWTSTTYSLLMLRHLGLPADNPQAQLGCEKFFFRGLEKDGGINFFKSMSTSETCINGMLLALLSYFRYPDQRLHSIVEFLLHEQMTDGGWNCQSIHGATHSSFHTTISVLEGFAEYHQAYPEAGTTIKAAADAAHEFLFRHQIYKSHRTGKPAYPAITLMHFPPRWRYDFIRALDYFQSIQTPPNLSMKTAIDLLYSKQSEDGRWIQNKPWNGQIFFQMEDTGLPSRWNTLRALRIIKWWNANNPQ